MSTPHVRVDKAFVDTLVQHAIGTAVERGAVPPALLLEMAEILGGTEWKDRRLDVKAEADRLFDLLDNSSAALPDSFLAIPVMSLGLLIAMIGLLKARVLPWWLPAAVIVGGVASGFVGSGAVALIGLIWSLAAVGIVVILARTFPARSDSA